MSIIMRILNGQEAAFDQKEITAMAMALEDVCNTLKVGNNKTAREIIAARIIELARRGIRSPTKLRDHLLADSEGGTGL